MSDFFENEEELKKDSENLPETEQPVKKDDYEGFDTIFSDPEQKRAATGKSTKNKKIISVIAAFLAVAVLVAGTLAVIKFIPKKEDEDTPASDEISVLTLDTNLIEKITVKNGNGKFVFLSERKKVESTEENSESEEENYETVWTLKGVNPEITDSDLISGTFTGISSISARREADKLSLKDCGLDNPRFTVWIESEKYGNFSILIGKDSPDTMGTYLKLSNKDNIYVVSGDLAESLDFDTLDLADVTDIDVIEITDDMDKYVSDSAITEFERLTVSGKNFKKPVIIEMNRDKLTGEYLPYLMKSPANRTADNIDTILSVFRNSITAESAYSVDVSASSLKKFNLDNPDVVIKLEIAGQTLTYKFAKTEDGYCAMTSTNAKIIKKVAVEDVAFIDYKEEDMYSSFVFLRGIDDIKDITFTENGKSYKFDIAYDHGENEDDSSDDILTVNCNGKKIDSDNFRKFYETYLGLVCKSFDTVKTDEKPEITVKVNYLDKYKRSETYTFTRTSAVKYQYSVDSRPLGNVTSSSYNKFVKALNKIVK